MKPKYKTSLSYNKLLVALCIGSSFLLTGCGGKKPAPEQEVIRAIKTMVVIPASEFEAREFPGRVQAATSADLSFRVPGTLTEFSAVAGRTVKMGDVLAQLDPRDYQSQVENMTSSIEEAQAQFAAMKAGGRPEEIRALEAEVTAAEAKYKEAQTQLKRMQEMVDSGIATKAQLDSMIKTRDVEKALLASTNEKLTSSKVGARKEDLDAMEARIAGLQTQFRDAKSSLSDTTMTAPFSGVVARTYVENFEDIQAKQQILSLQDDSAVEIIINIPESAMARGDRNATIDELAESLDATASFTSYPGREFPITLKDYETEADSVTQTFAISFLLQQPDDANIRPGMNAIVIGNGNQEASNAGAEFHVPINAVLSGSDGKSSVWLIDDATGEVHAASVETGGLTGENIIITGGLSPGDHIATSATNSLREGMKIRSINTTDETSE